MKIEIEDLKSQVLELKGTIRTIASEQKKDKTSISAPENCIQELSVDLNETKQMLEKQIELTKTVRNNTTQTPSLFENIKRQNRDRQQPKTQTPNIIPASTIEPKDTTDTEKDRDRQVQNEIQIKDTVINQIKDNQHPPELQLNKANTSDTEATFLDLHLSISNGFVSSKIYDKRDDFDFDIVNFQCLDGDVPRSTSYGIYISQLIRFARVSSHVVDFNARNKSLTAKLLQQDCRYHKLRKTFSKFYRRHYELVSKFSVGLKTLLHQGLSEPFGFEGRIWDLIVSVPDHCLSFYLSYSEHQRHKRFCS